MYVIINNFILQLLKNIKIMIVVIIRQIIIYRSQWYTSDRILLRTIRENTCSTENSMQANSISQFHIVGIVKYVIFIVSVGCLVFFIFYICITHLSIIFDVLN